MQEIVGDKSKKQISRLPNAFLLRHFEDIES